VLKRTSIRTKLTVALVVFSFVFCLLVSAVIVALSAYNGLALELAQHSRELGQVSDLHATAFELRYSFESKKASDQDFSMLNNEMGDNLLDYFHAKGGDFESLGNQFETSLETCYGLSSSQSTTLLMPEVERDGRLADIKGHFETLKELEPFGSEFSFKRYYNGDNLDKTEKCLDSLGEACKMHAESTHRAFTIYSDQVRRQARFWLYLASVCAVATVLLLVTFFWFFNSYIAKPFRTLIDGSRLVASGEFGHRIDLGTEDELNELGQAMNGMTDRFRSTLLQLNATCAGLDREVKERTRELIQNEQLASVGFLAAGVAHEINNPLATIAMSSEVLQSRLSELLMLPPEQRLLNDELQQELPRNLRRIEEEAYRCKGITEKLLDFSRLSKVQRVPVNLVDVVNEVVDMVGQLGEYRCKTISTHASDNVIAEADPQEIRQVILNLVTNALESVDTDGTVDIHVDCQGGDAVVVVEDTGCGMDAETQLHLFEPFFTRRRDGTGTGLGLSISYRIVSKHGGSLKPHSDGPGCGSRMVLTLPSVALEEKQNTGNPVSLGLEYESYQKVG